MTDDEIAAEADKNYEENKVSWYVKDSYQIGFIAGAKCVRDKVEVQKAQCCVNMEQENARLREALVKISMLDVQAYPMEIQQTCFKALETK